MKNSKIFPADDLNSVLYIKTRFTQCSNKKMALGHRVRVDKQECVQAVELLKQARQDGC